MKAHEETKGRIAMKIEIKNRWTGAVLWSGEAETIRGALVTAVKARADLAGADLRGAKLAGANLADADLKGADLKGTPRRTPAERAALYRERHPEVPVVPNLDQRILDAIAQPGASLDMGMWHSCENAHCRAGWAIHLAGEAGYALEMQLGQSELAGRAIYLASTGRSPHFYATNEMSLEDMRRCAAEDAEAK